MQDGFDRGLIGQRAGRIQQSSISIFDARHTTGVLRRSPLACSFERALTRGAACVDRSIPEHLLKTEQDYRDPLENEHVATRLAHA